MTISMIIMIPLTELSCMLANLTTTCLAGALHPAGRPAAWHVWIVDQILGALLQRASHAFRLGHQGPHY